MDITSTAQSTLQAAVAVPALVQASVGALASPLTGAGLVLGFAIEHGLEHTVVNYVPAKLKPCLPWIAGLGAVTLAGLQQGLPLKAALWTGLMATVTATVKHDVAPASTGAPA
jgi:hypothetical protein